MSRKKSISWKMILKIFSTIASVAAVVSVYFSIVQLNKATFQIQVAQENTARQGLVSVYDILTSRPGEELTIQQRILKQSQIDELVNGLDFIENEDEWVNYFDNLSIADLLATMRKSGFFELSEFEGQERSEEFAKLLRECSHIEVGIFQLEKIFSIEEGNCEKLKESVSDFESFRGNLASLIVKDKHFKQVLTELELGFMCDPHSACDYNLYVHTVGGRIIQLWDLVCPGIGTHKDSRGGNDVLYYFENVVARILKNSGVGWENYSSLDLPIMINGYSRANVPCGLMPNLNTLAYRNRFSKEQGYRKKILDYNWW